jgi:hypothetical protein
MKKKESLGVTLYGVLFILVGIYIINTPIGYLKLYFPKNPMFELTYKAAEAKLGDLEEAKTAIKDSAKLAQFNKKANEFRNELLRYKYTHILYELIPLPALLIMFFGFTVGILYLVAGIAVLRLLRSASKLSLWSVTLGLIIFPLLLWDAYSMLISICNFTNRGIDLAKIINPDEKISYVSGPLSMIFSSNQGPIFLITLGIYVAFMLSVIFFFSRPKIKQQFLQ